MAYSTRKEYYGLCYISLTFVYVAWLQFGNGASLPTSLVLPGAAVCDAKNRDPCSTFPDLCSTGGGLCVLKGPCEYECVCPPDGRRGRDCTGRDDSPNPPRVEDSETSNRGGLLNSLLIFPQDLFWDLNHVLRPEESVKMMRSTPAANLRSDLRTTSSPDRSSQSVAILRHTTAISSEADGKRVLINHLLKTTSQPVMISQPVSTEQSRQGHGLHQQNNDTTLSNDINTSTTRTMTSTTHQLLSSFSQPTRPITTVSPASTSKSNSFTKATDRITFLDTNFFKGSDSVHSTNEGRGEDTRGINSMSSNAIDTAHSSTIATPKVASLPLTPQAVIHSPVTILTHSSTPYPSFSSSISTTNAITDLFTRNDNTRTLFNESIQKPMLVSGIATTSAASPTKTTSQSSFRDNVNNFLKSLVTTTSRLNTGNLNLREPFPGHSNFPTFFSNVPEEANPKKDPLNAAMSKRVHRVFYPIPQFEKIERRRV